MKKGTQAKATLAKPVEGKKDTSKPSGGKTYFGTTPAGRPGKKVKKG
jgi:hypothetical protein